jgi:large subunit ribosomal protein L9
MSVRLILKQDIDHLGQAGDLVSVRPGYARNYLLPFGYALLATLPNLEWLREHRQALAAAAARDKELLEAKRRDLENLGELLIEVPVGPTGQLFGRVDSKSVVAKIRQLSEGNIRVDHKKVHIVGYPKGVEAIGRYEVVAELGSKIVARLGLNVTERPVA